MVSAGSISDLPVGDVADGADQVGARDLLEHVAGGAGHDRGEQRLVVVVRRQDQAPIARVHRADRAAHLDPGAVGQPGVEHRDVGTQRRDPAGGLDRRAGLAHDLDVTRRLEQEPEPLTDHLVVVEQVHAELSGC